MRPLVVLRPEPGNAATCARITAAGAVPFALPLFAMRPLPWTPPPVSDFDALFLTSANAVRHAGNALGQYRGLPVFAVGAATASTARAAGFSIDTVGDNDAAELAERACARGVRRALHLGGRHRAQTDLPGVVETIAVYASEPIAPSAEQLAALAGTVALIHSPRAGAYLATLAPDPAAVRIAAISDAALAAVGPGWADGCVAPLPNDESLIATALSLAD